MKKPQFFLSILLFLSFSVCGEEENIIDLEPYEVTESPFCFWGFSIKANYKNALIPDGIDKVTSYDVGYVVKGGTADKCGLRPMSLG